MAEVLILAIKYSTDGKTIDALWHAQPLPAVWTELHAVGRGRLAEP